MPGNHSSDSRMAYIELMLDGGGSVYISKGLLPRLGWLMELWREFGYRVGSYHEREGLFPTKKNDRSSLYLFRSRFASSLHHSDGGLNEYVIVPGPKNPRWIIANDSGVIKNHGPIIKPSTTISKMVWSLALALNRVGLFTAIFPYRLVMDSAGLGDGLFSPSGVQSSILYTGARGRYQKFTLQYNDSDNKPRYFLKVSTLPDAYENLKNEMSALEQLAILKKNNDGAFRDICFPSVASNVHAGRIFGFVQNSVLSKERLVAGFLSQDAEFVMEMYRLFPVRYMNADMYMRHLINGLSDKYRKIFFGLADSDVDCADVVLAASHGDYIPWNRFFDGNALKVIDWECFGYRPVFYDVVHFCVFESINVTRLKPENIITYIFDSIRKCVYLSDDFFSSKNIDVRLHVKLCLKAVYVHVISNNDGGDSQMLSSLGSLLTQLEKSDAANSEMAFRGL